VAFCIGITDVDPIAFELLFERFLNPERISMPDFDIDFCYNRREEVIDYVKRKYGEDKVAQIVTFGTLAARAAVRDVGRALGMPYARVDTIAKLIPRELNVTIEWVRMQIKSGMAGLTAEQAASVVIAYEPIWAIGTGRTATADQAQEVCGAIRECIKEMYDEATAETIRILYGGSVSTKSVNELMAQPNIDGGLVGGASLKADSFVELCQAAAK
jgi:arginine utilization protein RocB